ncbi:MAG: hypothetical protein WC780_02115 [Lentimicrobiaceae bacterium]|jgi:hypothetical protein
MKKFIELTRYDKKKVIINLDNVSFIDPNKLGCSLHFTYLVNGFPYYIQVVEEYETLLNYIKGTTDNTTDI